MSDDHVPFALQDLPNEVIARLRRVAVKERATRNKLLKGTTFADIRDELKALHDESWRILTEHFLPLTGSMPEWAAYMKVDEVIECLPVSMKTGQLLMDLMPEAYDDHPDDEVEWPEADSYASRKLARIWDRMPEEARLNVLVAYYQDILHLLA